MTLALTGKLMQKTKISENNKKNEKKKDIMAAKRVNVTAWALTYWLSEERLAVSRKKVK